MKLNNVGFHASFVEVEKHKENWSHFQIFFASPLQFMMQPTPALLVALSRFIGDGVQFVVHSPYWYSLCRSSRFTKLSLKSLFQHVELMADHGIKYFVVHPGGLGSDNTATTREGAMAHLFEMSVFISRKLPSGVEVCWENSPSSKTGTKGLNALETAGVTQQVRDAGFKNIGFCFDTQHAYCAGESLDSFEKFFNLASVIHLNPNPPGVAWGSYRDRHTETPLRESAGYSGECLVEVVKRFPDKVKIIESSPAFAEDNYNFIKERL